MRMAAIRHILRLQEQHGILNSPMIEAPFLYDDGTHRQELRPSLLRQGIWTPGGWRTALSFRSVVPSRRSRLRYSDQSLQDSSQSTQELHRNIYEGLDSISYDLQDGDPEHPRNKPLLRALESQEPMIYFVGLSVGRYIALAPVFVASASDTQIELAIGSASLQVAEDAKEEEYVLPAAPLQRQYAVKEVKQRLHQASFRNQLLVAYKERCAMSKLPEPRLLHAAHIIPDAEQEGHPSVTNGLLLASTYHSAYDANLIGVDPKYQIHVSKELLDRKDGPTLEAIKALNERKLHIPRKLNERPNPEALAQRYDLFKQAQGFG